MMHNPVSGRAGGGGGGGYLYWYQYFVKLTIFLSKYSIT